MAWTQADLESIDKALATGARRVRFQTHEVEYRSVAEMLKVRDMIAGAIDSEAPRAGVILTEYHGGA